MNMNKKILMLMMFGEGDESRNFTTYDPALSQYNVIPVATAAGDFELEFEFSASVTGVGTVLCSEDQLNGMWVYIEVSSGRIILRTTIAGSNYYLAPTNNVNDGKLHSCELRFVANTYYMSVDGGAELSQFRAGVNNNVKFLCCRSDSVLFFNGIIANVNFKSGFTQVGNVAGNPKYDIAEPDGSTVLVNSNGGDGNGTIVNAPFAELFTLNTTTTPEQWENADKSVIIEVVT